MKIQESLDHLRLIWEILVSSFLYDTFKLSPHKTHFESFKTHLNPIISPFKVITQVYIYSFRYRIRLEVVCRGNVDYAIVHTRIYVRPKRKSTKRTTRNSLLISAKFLAFVDTNLRSNQSNDFIQIVR